MRDFADLVRRHAQELGGGEGCGGCEGSSGAEETASCVGIGVNCTDPNHVAGALRTLSAAIAEPSCVRGARSIAGAAAAGATAAAGAAVVATAGVAAATAATVATGSGACLVARTVWLASCLLPAVRSLSPQVMARGIHANKVELGISARGGFLHQSAFTSQARHDVILV